jgi:HPr kinase/phosphorylase
VAKPFNRRLNNKPSVSTVRTLEDPQTLHGVFLEVSGVGLLLRGDASIGKSELALELISRGHRLIADDAPLFSMPSAGTIHGSCSSVLQDFLEVRGLGVLNIRAMFGDSAIMMRKTLDLVITLTPYNKIPPNDNHRLTGIASKQELLGIPIPKITLPIAPGRNLAVLVEAAALKHLLQINGYNAAVELQSRLKQQLETSVE